MELGMKNRNFLTTSIRTVDETNYRITHVVNTKTLDRYGTVVLPKGANVEHYKKNPVVLWLHNTDDSVPGIPVGKCVDLVIGEDEITVTTEFNPNDALAMKVFNAYKDGFLNAWSIGFMPKSGEEITPVNYEELKKKYNLQNLNLTQKDFEDNQYYGLWVINEWELLEYSCVPVPGNPEALSDEDCNKFSRELVTRGICEDVEARKLNFRELFKKKAEKDVKPVEKPAEVAPVAPAPEAAQEAAPEVTPAPAAEATPAPAEGAKPEAAASTVSTPEGRQTPENVAEKADVEALRAELAAVKSENETLKVTVGELSQKNDGLTARLVQVEADVKATQEALKEVEGLRSQMAEMRKTVEVDNIDTVRQVASQKAKGGNAEGFFSNLLSRK